MLDANPHVNRSLDTEQTIDLALAVEKSLPMRCDFDCEGCRE